MRLWIRAAAVRRRVICLWLLLLGFALISLALSDLFNQDQDHSHQNPDPPRQPLQRIPSAPDLEIIVNSWDPALELGMDVAPLESLQEDQLLYVPLTLGTKSPQQRKGSYKVILPGVSKEPVAPAPQTHGKSGGEVRPQLKDADLELSAVQKFGFNEVASQSISLHHRLPDTRHPE